MFPLKSTHPRIYGLHKLGLMRKKKGERYSLVDRGGGVTLGSIGGQGEYDQNCMKLSKNSKN